MIDFLKGFPEQKLNVHSDDLGKGKTKWWIPLSTLIRKFEIMIEKNRTKMIQLDDMVIDATPDSAIGHGRLFRVWVQEHQFHSTIQLNEPGGWDAL
jgi:hypothetical protein